MRTFVAFVVAFALAGCGGEHDNAHEAGHEDHGDGHAGHQHEAPNGGLLVELGDHAANVELLLDAETGTLTVYLLGPHAEHPVRSDAAALDVTVQVGGKEIALELLPVAKTLSGEKAGDTSTFKVQHGALIGAKRFTGRVGPLRLRGVEFEATAFAWPAD